jgi:NTE family protein
MAGTLKISLALSGGAARGAFHLGVIAACERHGIEIGAISGTSIGAVVATGVGSGVSAFDMIRLFKSEAFRKVIGFNYFQKGLFRIDETASILREICPVSSLEEMRIPTFITCVDMNRGKLVRFSKGDAIKLAIASSALIPIFRPIVYENYLLIDGGFMDNLPVSPLLDFDDPIVSVNLHPLHVKTKHTLPSMVKRSLFLLFMASSQLQISKSDLYISDPELSSFGLFTFGELMRCFELGYARGSESLLTFMAQKSII